MQIGFRHYKTISKNDVLYCIVLFVLVLISVLQNNVLIINADFILKAFNYIELVIYAVLVFLIVQKDYSVKHLLCAFLLGVILLVGYYKSGMAIFVRALLLILAARNVKFNSIQNTIMNSMTAGILISFMLYLIQVIRGDMPIFLPEGHTLGFVAKNTSGELLCLLGMMAMYTRIKQSEKIHYLFILTIGFVLYTVTKSKTAVMIFWITPFVMKLSIMIFKHRNSRILKFLFYAINPALFLFSYVTARLYPENAFVQKLDNIVTNRIFLNSYVLNKYGTTLFGQHVNLHDTGIYNPVTGIGNITITVDNAYIVSLVSLGLIPTLIFITAYFLVLRKAFKDQNYALVGIAVLLCLYGFTEVVTLEIYVNFVFFSLLADTKVLLLPRYMVSGLYSYKETSYEF